MSEMNREDKVESYKRMILATHDHLEALLAELERLQPAGARHEWVVDDRYGEKQVRARFDREDDDS